MLCDLPGISFFPAPRDVKSSCWFSGIVVDNANHQIIKKICHDMKNMGVEARPFWKPVHTQKPYINAKKGDTLHVTEEVWEKILTLPCSTRITDRELETVVNVVKKVV